MSETAEACRARKARKKAAANEIGRLPKVKDPARRERCRTSLLEFLKTYCMGAGGFLKTAPSARMGKILQHLQTVISVGGREHVRMARAHGKTCFIKGGCLWGLAYGYRRFIVAVAARKADASAIIEDIFTLCEEGEAFAEDFPEIAVPIRRLGGIMQRAANQTHKGRRTRIQRTAERIALPSIKGSAAAGALLVARGFKGAARGLVRGSMRPDLVLFDDLQDDKAAHNPKTVMAYDELIEKNFMGLGGHDRQIAALMTSTPICPDDLSELYAGKKNWKTFTFPMIISHPRCWGMPGDKWRTYFAIRQEAIADGEPEHVRANEFYAANRAEMDAGAEVLNPDFYDHETELSGIQHAMNLRFANGEDSFAAEYQMQPVREHAVHAISAPLIASRVRTGVPPFTVPEGTVFTAAGTDLNPSYGFTTAFMCFDRAQTGFVTWYHVFTGAPLPVGEDIPNAEWHKRVFAALVNHGRQIADWCRGHRLRLDRWTVDAGGKAADTVFLFAANSQRLCGVNCLPSFGRAGANWNPYVKSRMADPRNETVLCADPPKGRRWLAFNADYWRETAQKAWLGEVGSPGGLSLFDGGGVRHGEFAAQIAAERLEYKITLQNGRTDYHWRQIGRKHDYGDAVTMCYALAGQFGIGAAGGYAPPPPRKVLRVADSSGKVRVFRGGRTRVRIV